MHIAVVVRSYSSHEQEQKIAERTAVNCTVESISKRTQFSENIRCISLDSSKAQWILLFFKIQCLGIVTI
jgi:hypothetical protein